MAVVYARPAGRPRRQRQRARRGRDQDEQESYVAETTNLLHATTRNATLCNMTVRNIGARPVTDLQQAILDFIWAQGAATSEQVREGLMPAHALKDPTVRTLLRRLESRGFLRHRTDGKVFVYQASVPRRHVAARAVQHIIDRFCAGSADQFLAGMVDEKVLTVEQIARLAKKVKRRS